MPNLRQIFPGQLDQLSLDDFVAAINRVEASLVRVEADEVSYGLHIILRYELERSLIEGELQVSDLESAWNEKMNEYLGMVPSTPADGVLQDTHWSQGLIGYFPTYLLGNLYASQIFSEAQATMPRLENDLRNGDLVPLREWLKERIHQHGKTLTADELILDISGETLSTHYFIDYLQRRFSQIYRL